MKGVCSLLVDAASAVADISALIWRISRSSVDGCMTFSFDLGPTTRFLISVHRKPATAGIANADCDTLRALHFRLHLASARNLRIPRSRARQCFR
jgi:hypothetical protein